MRRTRKIGVKIERPTKDRCDIGTKTADGKTSRDAYRTAHGFY